MRAVLAILALAILAAGGPPAARAQEEGVVPAGESIGVPDSVFQEPVKLPFIYFSTYDRDRASASWTQSATYGIRRKALAIDLAGGSTTIDDILRAGFAGRGGQFSGRINFRATPRWYLGVDGRFQANSSGDVQSGTRQHQNGITLRTQYSSPRWNGLSGVAILSTQFQRDHSLSYRPITSGNAFTQRDSTTVTGRKDGATGQLDWAPFAGFSATLQGGGSRAKPLTATVKRRSLRYSPGSGPQDSVLSDTTTANPLTNSNLVARIGFKGIPKVTTGLQLRRLLTVDEYFDPLSTDTLSNQEHSSLDQRAGSIHLEAQPSPPLSFIVDGTLSHTFRQFRLRKSSTSLVRAQQMAAMAVYARPEARASVRLEITRAKNERQISQNGVSITRFLTATAARRITSRLWLDGTGSATLSSYQYDYPAGTVPLANDRDDARNFFNVGGGYAVSAPCSVTVHFSRSRSHSVAVGAQSSGDNVVQTNYQMIATLQLRPSRNLSIQQNYLMSAVYQIYDYYDPGRSRDFLSRIKRIDTVMSDTLLPYVYAALVHNFLFRDVGPYAPVVTGGKRLYNVSVETYQQNLAVTLGICSPAGITAFLTQNLANTRDRSLVSATEDVTNRWSLTFGGDITRTLQGETQLHVSAQRIAAYTERPPDRGGIPPVWGDFERQEEGYWVVTASVQKAF